ncbi:MAG: putative periplasmic nitrate reductase, small subunit (napB) [Deltaproteobacteria bacterium]|nr:putative periplasmic nitrate reductase, small subunit (napB) [Deltaproteobacteria bacterium]
MKKPTKIVLASSLIVTLAFSFGPAAAQQSAASGSTKLQRAYPGAPPIVPHDTEVRKALCLTCHEAGLAGAPIVPHPTRNHLCLQCHVGQDQTAKPFVSGTNPAK